MLTKELYTGCARTPIYAHISEIRFRKKKFITLFVKLFLYVRCEYNF